MALNSTAPSSTATATATTAAAKAVTVTSFGYGHAPAPEAELTIDARRYLRNPHHDAAMRDKTGLAADVYLHVMITPGARGLVRNLTTMTADMLHDATGRPQHLVRVAIGCAGGRHRSVALTEALANELALLGIDVTVEHRDVDKPLLTLAHHADDQPVTHTDPDVLSRGVTEGWADPITDPSQIDWEARQAAALVPFQVVAGRPLNPCAPTGIRYGRNELGHWGEQVCADAIATLHDQDGHRYIAMIWRGDGHGCALPGGKVDTGEEPTHAAIRELAEETGLALGENDAILIALPARVVPDPRASDEAWMVTVPVRAHMGTRPRDQFPTLTGADDADRAEWIPSDTYEQLVDHLAALGGTVFAAHQAMLAELLA
ncbi:NUDIX domain-containing protein [Sphaerisporangium album]|uniref:NUDIX domain-containing protein n=1 Tax=Sphaerisporangium album TaxID=509200 RepID=A0A367FSS9_9ACTN|nr:RNase adapter RapZ [Sphaerisporangium album]RCG32979.1 NUDIX domain-containing protein [Sphaerisporangium album]